MSRMWEDERAPSWRRRLLICRIVGGGFLFVTATFLVLVMLTDTWWGFAGALLSAYVTLSVFAAGGTYKGRLERPARKATDRVRKEARRVRAAEHATKSPAA
ncbi:hypothetical protein [Blastococcus sp. SYSU DS0619]